MPRPSHRRSASMPYPAMSHPSVDPTTAAATTRMLGLQAPDPATGKILEIGCGSGHHLIPLALRWPACECVGIDRDERAIHQARRLAAIAGARNIRFIQGNFPDFNSEPGPHDWIIANGFLSWVPDEVKAMLGSWIANRLAPNGIAMISFNVRAGWTARQPIIQRAQAILSAGAKDPVHALTLLREVTPPGSPELEIIDDMLAKGLAVLTHDDFAAVNDPLTLPQVAAAALAAGLRWIGESEIARTVPKLLSPAVLTDLRKQAQNTVEFLHATDELAGTTFRTALFCRSELPVPGTVPPTALLDLGVRLAPGAEVFHDPELYAALASFHPHCIPLAGLFDPMHPSPPDEVIRRVFAAIQQGWIQARSESVIFDSSSPARPRLSPFRLECARRRLPLVDIWQVPCSFPVAHFDLLARMDGTADTLTLATYASRHCPELDFPRWLAHLAERGMFE